MLIVDGLDHVTRVRGRHVGGAFHEPVDPARALVDELAALNVPAGVALLPASSPATTSPRSTGQRGRDGPAAEPP